MTASMATSTAASMASVVALAVVVGTTSHTSRIGIAMPAALTRIRLVMRVCIHLRHGVIVSPSGLALTLPLATGSRGGSRTIGTSSSIAAAALGCVIRHRLAGTPLRGVIHDAGVDFGTTSRALIGIRRRRWLWR